MNTSGTNQDGVQPAYFVDPSNGIVYSRADYIRIIERSLRDMGYNETASLLESESGLKVDSNDASKLFMAISEGDWQVALTCTERLTFENITQNEIQLKILERKFIEFLENGDTAQALQCMQIDLVPLLRNDTSTPDNNNSNNDSSNRMNLADISNESSNSNELKETTSIESRTRTYQNGQIEQSEDRLKALATCLVCPNREAIHEFAQKNNISTTRDELSILIGGYMDCDHHVKEGALERIVVNSLKSTSTPSSSSSSTTRSSISRIDDSGGIIQPVVDSSSFIGVEVPLLQSLNTTKNSIESDSSTNSDSLQKVPSQFFKCMKDGFGLNGQAPSLCCSSSRVNQSTLLGHNDEVWGCSFSPDGSVIASYTKNGEIFLWSVGNININTNSDTTTIFDDKGLPKLPKCRLLCKLTMKPHRSAADDGSDWCVLDSGGENTVDSDDEVVVVEGVLTNTEDTTTATTAAQAELLPNPPPSSPSPASSSSPSFIPTGLCWRPDSKALVVYSATSSHVYLWKIPNPHTSNKNNSSSSIGSIGTVGYHSKFKLSGVTCADWIVLPTEACAKSAREMWGNINSNPNDNNTFRYHTDISAQYCLLLGTTTGQLLVLNQSHCRGNRGPLLVISTTDMIPSTSESNSDKIAIRELIISRVPSLLKSGSATSDSGISSPLAKAWEMSTSIASNGSSDSKGSKGSKGSKSSSGVSRKFKSGWYVRGSDLNQNSTSFYPVTSVITSDTTTTTTGTDDNKGDGNGSGNMIEPSSSSTPVLATSSMTTRSSVPYHCELIYPVTMLVGDQGVVSVPLVVAINSSLSEYTSSSTTTASTTTGGERSRMYSLLPGGEESVSIILSTDCKLKKNKENGINGISTNYTNTTNGVNENGVNGNHDSNDDLPIPETPTTPTTPNSTPYCIIKHTVRLSFHPKKTSVNVMTANEIGTIPCTSYLQFQEPILSLERNMDFEGFTSNAVQTILPVPSATPVPALVMVPPKVTNPLNRANDAVVVLLGGKLALLSVLVHESTPSITQGKNAPQSKGRNNSYDFQVSSPSGQNNQTMTTATLGAISNDSGSSSSIDHFAMNLKYEILSSRQQEWEVFQSRLQLRGSLGGTGRSSWNTDTASSNYNNNNNSSKSILISGDKNSSAKKGSNAANGTCSSNGKNNTYENLILPGPVVAAGGEDGSILICSNQHAAKLKGHSDAVNQVQWSSVTQGLLVSASDDNSLRLWRLA